MDTDTQDSGHAAELAQAEGLKAQIEQFTNFSGELVGGGSVKKIMADVSAKSADLWQVPPEEIYVMPGLNPRVHNLAYYQGLDALAKNMARDGYMQDKPLAVYIAKIDGKDRLVLQDGHRRYGSVLLAKGKYEAPIKTIPIVVKPKSANQADLTRAMLHANENTPFTVYEKAVFAKRFKSFGWTDKQIADEMNCTTAFVGQMLTLAGAPQAIQELVDSGNVSATMAYDVIKEHGSEASEVLQQAVKNAAAKGKTRATARDIPSAADQKMKNAKKVGIDLYKALKKLRDDPAIEKRMDTKLLETIDELFAVVEKVRKSKPAPAPKPIKVAKKTPAKKASKKSAKPEKRAPWDQPQARSHVAAQRRSDR